MLTPADARRRWFGAFFLIVAAGLLIWGQTVLKPHLDGIWFLLYWLVCFGFTALAMLTALLDFWIMRRKSRQSQKDLLQKALSRPKPKEESGGGSSEKSPR
jgi:hypothetical protein